METTAVLFTPVVTSAEAAEQLGVGRQTIPVWVKKGLIEPCRTIGAANGTYLFTQDEVDRVKTAPWRRKRYARRTAAA